MTLEEYRRDFDISANRSVSMPIAGAIVWLIVGLLSTQLSERAGVLVLMFGTGVIFPIALLIARIRGEGLMSSDNPLAKLMGLCVLMVNLLWAVHIPLFLYAPEFVPLSLGVGLGLHWVVYSWIVQHSVGLVHAILRTILVLAVWLAFPDNRLLAVALVIVFAYGVSIWQMLSRPLNLHITSGTVSAASRS